MRAMLLVLAGGLVGCSGPDQGYRSDFPVILASGEVIPLRAGMHPAEVKAVVAETRFWGTGFNSLMERCITHSGEEFTVSYLVDASIADGPDSSAAFLDGWWLDGN
jgi:hypothetical protein